jgi:hypothetical protein
MSLKEVRVLTDKALSNSPAEVREHALLQLMLLIERRYRRINHDGDTELLEVPFKSIKLDRNAELDIVRRLAETIDSESSDRILCGIFSVLGASRLPEALLPLIASIRRPEIRRRHVALQQAVASIDSIAFYYVEPEIGNVVDQADLPELLKALLPTGNNSVDDRIRSALSNIASVSRGKGGQP